MMHSNSIGPLVSGRGLVSGLALSAALAAIALPAQAQAQDAATSMEADDGELLDLSLEDLLTLESTSVAKKRQRVEDSAAAVTVITQDDIRGSTATTIPELLQMVPGVEVGPLGNGATAVAIRGFNGRASNNLLVMVDGRSIYISTLAGVFWDQLALPLGDIERIEVIRGAGAALWGSNAVNGVINIITKHSADTLGANASVRVGSRVQQASLSYGGRIAEDLSYRVQGHYRRDEGLVDAAGKNQVTQPTEVGSVGMRLDWEPSARDAFTLSAEYIDGRNYTATRLPDTDPLNAGYILDEASSDTGGYNVVARWVRRQSDYFDWSFQLTYDDVGHDELGNTRIDWRQGDLDLGFHWKASDVHDLNFGVGARLMEDRIIASEYLLFDPETTTDRWVSAYVQDDISIIPDKLRLVLGAKVENNNYTGWEIQPSAKVFFRPVTDIALWGGVSRAVRTPSRYERDAVLLVVVDAAGAPGNPTGLPIYTNLLGASDRSARLISFEAGIRASIAPGWSLDIAGYHNDYADMASAAFGSVAPIFVEGIPFPVALDSNIDLVAEGSVDTWGGEVTLAGQLQPWWQVQLNWSHFNYSVGENAVTGQPYNLLTQPSASPRNQFKASSAIDFSNDISFNADLRHIGEIAGGMVPAYFTADVRLSASPLPNLELSLIGENLFEARHIEFYEPGYPAPVGFVPRSVAAEVRYRF